MKKIISALLALTMLVMDYYLKDIDYASYVANAKSSAKQSRDVDTQNGAPLLLLSTCYAPDTTTRSVLFARLEKNVK